VEPVDEPRPPTEPTDLPRLGADIVQRPLSYDPTAVDPRERAIEQPEIHQPEIHQPVNLTERPRAALYGRASVPQVSAPPDRAALPAGPVQVGAATSPTNAAPPEAPMGQARDDEEPIRYSTRPFTIESDIPPPDVSGLGLEAGEAPHGYDGEDMDRPLAVPQVVAAAEEPHHVSQDWRSNLRGGGRPVTPVAGGTVYRGETEPEQEEEEEPLSRTQWILRTLVVLLIVGALVFSFLEGPWISSHI
jgi:hypothetical protein